MTRRAGAVALAGLVVLAAACGVRTQQEPEILPTPPAVPTATPSATERPSPSRGTLPPSPVTPSVSMRTAPADPPAAVPTTPSTTATAGSG